MHYFRILNARQAALHAGYSPGNAANYAHELVVQAAARWPSVNEERGGADEKLLEIINAQILSIEGHIRSLMAALDDMCDDERHLRSVPGIGPVCASLLIAELPELGSMTAGQTAAMAGLAPIAQDSGILKGRRMIAGGRKALRKALFQADLAASF